MQDIRLGFHTETLARLNAIAPAPIQPTAPLLRDEPERFFFALDGHLNAQGARKIAHLLLAEHDPS